VKALKEPKKRLIVCRARLTDVPAETRKKLYAIAVLVKRATNRAWQHWEQQMFSQRADQKLLKFLNDLTEWKKTRSGPKPKPGFYPVSKEWLSQVSLVLKLSYPGLHVRVRSLILNEMQKRIKELPSKKCPTLKLWQAVLLSHESPSRSNDALPIHFDRQNAEIIEESGNLFLQVRIDRLESGDKKNAESILDRFCIYTASGAKRSWYTEQLFLAARGEIPWAGSKIVYKSRKRQWVAMIAVELPLLELLETTDLPATAVQALLSAPEEKCCWLLKLPRKIVRIGSGRSLAWLREKLFYAKRSRRADPMRSPARNGHGRGRCMKAVGKVSGQWDNIAGTLCNQLVARVVKECVLAGVKKLAYKTPGEKCFINAVAAEYGPAWPLYKIREKLARKCLEAGIELQICGDISAATLDTETVSAGSVAE